MSRSDALRARWKDPEFRRAVTEAARLRMIERMANPEIASALAAANRKRMKKRYRDPFEREATALQLKKARAKLKANRLKKRGKDGGPKRR